MGKFSIINTITLLLFTIVILFSSCEDVIKVDLDPAPNQLVVDAKINDFSASQTINLFLTAPYFENGFIPTATAAEVTIADNEGHTVLFQEISPGVYQTNNLLGKSNNTYTLTIKYQGETYWATAKMPRTSVVDSIVYESTTNNRNNNQKRYSFYLYAQEPRGIGDNYKAKGFVNNQEQENAENIFVTLKDDLIVDGNYIKQEEIFRSDQLKDGDLVRIEFMSIERKVHDFYLQAALQSRGGLFNPPPSNIKGNISNTNSVGKQALGLFVASAVNVFEGKVIGKKGKLLKK